MSVSYTHLFLGFKENPYPLIKSCDVFVLSSLYEGLPTVIIEALILERNIVSSPCAVSYTHLDVYKRQNVDRYIVEDFVF